jgi:hypothetical protein
MVTYLYLLSIRQAVLLAVLRAPGIRKLDEDGSSPLQNTIGSRETHKLNVNQAVRDATGYIRLD